MIRDEETRVISAFWEIITLPDCYFLGAKLIPRRAIRFFTYFRAFFLAGSCRSIYLHLKRVSSLSKYFLS